MQLISYRMYMRTVISLICLCLWMTLQAQSDSLFFRTTILNAEHPRLLWKRNEPIDGISSFQHSTTPITKVHTAIIEEANRQLTLPVVQRVMEGRRLLSVSREALKRILYLSYAYRCTHEKAYATKAITEMQAVANFTDWNPSHFLDVAEMATAMAIGYDWLYSAIPDSTKTVFEQAIYEKALLPSLDKKYNGWLKGNNNWNQVCNTGLSLAAMAIYEQQPNLADSIICRAIRSVTLPMQTYQPNGAYPEGYNYWEYGTAYNVLLLSALEKIWGTDFGLSANHTGFMQTPFYYLHAAGTTGWAFNYSDCGNTRYEVSASMFWFAQKLNNSSLLHTQLQFIQQKSIASLANNRLLPTLMLWQNQASLTTKSPKDLCWLGEGLTPVACMRTDWNDPDALYLAIKGGSAANSHAHMDAGSFVLDALGERWAADLGMETYGKLEAAGWNIWDMKATSQRWQVFRYNNFAHNTLTINNTLHAVNGKAEFIDHHFSKDEASATLNLTELFNNQVARATRQAILQKNKVTINDEIVTHPSSAPIQWTLVTPAAVQIINDSTLQLTQKNKCMLVTFNGNQTKVQAFIKTATPATLFENPNKGYSITGFLVELPPNTRSNLKVTFYPAVSK